MVTLYARPGAPCLGADDPIAVGLSFPDIFEWILEHIGDLPMPRRSSKARAMAQMQGY